MAQNTCTWILEGLSRGFSVPVWGKKPALYVNAANSVCSCHTAPSTPRSILQHSAVSAGRWPWPAAPSISLPCCLFKLKVNKGKEIKSWVWKFHLLCHNPFFSPVLRRLKQGDFVYQLCWNGSQDSPAGFYNSMFTTKSQILSFQEKQGNKGMNMSWNFQHTYNEVTFFETAVWSFPVTAFKTAYSQK